MKMAFTGICALVFATTAVSAQEIQWEYPLKGGVKPSKVSTSTFLYGKTWAYAIELDDGNVLSKTVAQPLFAEYKFTDAPPGAKGGREMPFVGTAAIMVCNMAGGNATVLSWADVKELLANGWDIANHSYWHTGCHWDKTKLLSPDQFRRELFWSQAVFSHYVYDDKRAPLTFVYPSGDYNYKPFMKEFNLLAGSPMAAPSGRMSMACSGARDRPGLSRASPTP